MRNLVTVKIKRLREMNQYLLFSHCQKFNFRVHFKLATQYGCKKANITFLDTKLVSLSIDTYYF